LKEYYDESDRAAGAHSSSARLFVGYGTDEADSKRFSRAVAFCDSGTRSPTRGEDRWTDDRCRLVDECAATRRALAQLSPLDQAVLATVHSVDYTFWRSYAEEIFGKGDGKSGKGPADKLDDAFGELVGVAILLSPEPNVDPRPSARFDAEMWHEPDEMLRSRIGANRGWRPPQLGCCIDDVAGDDLDRAALWLGMEREHHVRLPRCLQRTKLRLDEHGRGGWLVAQLNAKIDLKVHKENVRKAYDGAMQRFCAAKNLAVPKRGGRRKVYTWKAPAVERHRIPSGQRWQVSPMRAFGVSA